MLKGLQAASGLPDTSYLSLNLKRKALEALGMEKTETLSAELLSNPYTQPETPDCINSVGTQQATNTTAITEELPSLNCSTALRPSVAASHQLTFLTYHVLILFAPCSDKLS